MGATIVLSYGISDPRTKICIGISGIYTFTDFIHNPENTFPFTLKWFNKMALKFQMSFKKERAVEEYHSPKYFFEQENEETLQKKARQVLPDNLTPQCAGEIF